MTNVEIINNEKYHTCGRCKHENTPDDKYPCVACIYGTDHRTDLWELKQQPCEDCVSRQEAILQVQRYGVGCFDAEEFSPEQCERFVIQKLNDLPPVTQKEKTEWISVSERLPEESKRYMVTTKYNDVMTDFYTGEMFLQGDDIIAWMPIPKPYEPQESEESK